MGEAYLKTDGLTVGYNRTPLIRDISFSLQRGEILVLIGPNGAGKSTILRTLIRELAPLGGAVLLDGRDLTQLSGAELAKHTASVRPGNISTEFLTVEDVVSMGRYPYTGALGLLSDADRKIVRSAMERFSILDLAGRDFSRLSDGQRQRVLLARAMCQQPELLVLDEPTSFLDIRYQLELLSSLRRMAREQKLSVILSLHEIDLARRVADRLLCVREGKIVRFGRPEEVFVPGFIESLFDIPENAMDGLRDLPLKTPAPEQTEEDSPSDHYVLSGGKRLRCGFTTGTCAALAAQACARRLLTGSWPEKVRLVTPKGWAAEVSPEDCSETESGVRCAVRKDAGDDADRTDGTLIYADMTLTDTPGITIDGGTGIGRVTKPGLDQPVGAAAINSVPRRMITETVRNVFLPADYSGGAEITISAPEGEEIAKHTFNPRLGIEGGISILGTSGVVEPMSVQALVDTIAVELRQAHVQGYDEVVLTPGNYGLDFLRSHNIQPPELPVVCCSNYIGEALDRCAALGFRNVLLVGHVGKLVKLAGGIMNTHSRSADCRTDLFCAHAAVCGADTDTCRQLMECATTDACLEVLERSGLREPVMKSLTDAADRYLRQRADGKFKVGAVMFSNEYGELGRTPSAEEIISEWNH